jgi:hypothetical protein
MLGLTWHPTPWVHIAVTKARKPLPSSGPFSWRRHATTEEGQAGRTTQTFTGREPLFCELQEHATEDSEALP